MTKVSAVRRRRGSDIRDVDVEILAAGQETSEPTRPVTDAAANARASPAQHPTSFAQPEPDTTAHAHSEGVSMDESPRDPAENLPRPSPIRPATAKQEPRGEMCEIAFWRGYVKASFYARVFDEDGEPVAIAQSPYFRSRGKQEPEATEEAVAAYEALRTQLERAGWQFAGDGNDWFATVFSRP